MLKSKRLERSHSGLVRALGKRVWLQSHRGFVPSFDGTPRRMTVANPTQNRMFYVYILYLTTKRFYTGFTSDLKRRIQEHKLRKVKYTKDKLPFKLVHYEAYYLESDARRREKYLKTTQGKKFLKQQMRDLLNSDLLERCESGLIG